MEIEKITGKGEYLYTRTFESMGKGLLSIRVDNIQKVQSPYHYLFDNGKKPPFDIAINPITKRICYFKFFLQDEKLEANKQSFDYESTFGEPVFSIEPFNENKSYISNHVEFESFFNNGNLIIVRKECYPQKAINISTDIKLLISNENNFAGVVFELLSEKDIFELQESEVIEKL